MKTEYNQDFFNNPEIWNPETWFYREGDRGRAKLAAEWLLGEVNTVLDVGCGNGVYTNLLEPGRFKVGLDMSRVALENVTAPRLLADASHLPFDDHSFDAGLSMEMLEHLPGSIYSGALSELKRISRMYILITVPYNEQIKFNLVVCPRCQHAFHPYHHLRQYRSQDLKTLFSPHYRLVRLAPLAAVKRESFPFLWNLIRVYQHRRGKNFPASAVCPHCGYTSSSSLDPGEPVSHVQTMNSRLKQLWPKRATYLWWIALYRKDNNE